MYAAKLTLEDATGSVDAHLFADDGAQFFQVPIQPCHWLTRTAAVTWSPSACKHDVQLTPVHLA